jgi:hypothetical protein
MTNRFPKNAQVVWRVRIVDPVTGDLMDDKSVKTLQTKLANGMTLDLKYAAHPKTSQNFFWTVSWIVPLSQPTAVPGDQVGNVANDDHRRGLRAEARIGGYTVAH